VIRIITGDCLEAMGELDAASVDAIATDPPYGLGFMGRAWDAGVPGAPFWEAALRVAKPGSHLVAFGGTRKFHRLACVIEDAGWELRDCLSWLYGSGFPKSHNIAIAIDKQAEAMDHRGKAIRMVTQAPEEQNDLEAPDPPPDHAPITDSAKAWKGWGTALKPAWEPIILARKPLTGTVAENVLEHGTGAVNVDGCRVGTGKDVPASVSSRGMQAKRASVYGTYGIETGSESGHDPNVGRWPANLILGCACEGEHDPGCAVAMVDEASGKGVSRRGGPRKSAGPGAGYGMAHTGAEYDDAGGASRFFYTAKASRAEREAGLFGASSVVNDGRETSIDNPYQRGDTLRRNTHPTVKPIALMQWLVRLITPPGGTVLDPFCGSGSTLIAADREGLDAIGIEINPGYAAIARDRAKGDCPLFADVKTEG
jgi:site-specific DNA-methyltransferase (adenine-specific)